MTFYRVYNHNSVTEDVTRSHANTLIERLYSDEKISVGKYRLVKNAIFYIESIQDDQFVKTFTVLSGQLRDLKTLEVFVAGDVILIGELEDIVSLHCEEDSILLVHSQSMTSIQSFYKYNEKLGELLNELQVKDHYTKEHSDHVFLLVKEMGLTLGYYGTRLSNLNKAARFHDIGKIYIDDQILNKRGALTDEEYEIIKTHAVLGKELILKAYGEEVFNIISQHHERVDGSGYPMGLKGGEICEEAKILAICDSYEAMISDRVVKLGELSDSLKEWQRSLSLM